MVGFDPGRKEKKISSTQCGVCGSVSGLVTRLVVQPFDVLKIRFQLQVEPTSKKIATGKYSGIWQAFKLIYKEEGFTSLWKGHVPAQVLSVVYGYFQFTAFEAITEVMWRVNPRCTDKKWKPVTHFVCGGLAGCLSSTIAQPLDVLRTRLVAQGEPKVYKNLIQAASKMYAKEGVRSFYKGLAPTLVQIFPHAGLQFGFYSFFKTLWEISFRIKRQDPYKAAGVDESLVCGALAGIFSKGVIYPLDMVKKRLQDLLEGWVQCLFAVKPKPHYTSVCSQLNRNLHHTRFGANCLQKLYDAMVQGFQEARETFGRVQKYNGMLDCFRIILREEGAFGFFKGLAPSTLKAGLSVAIIFCTYEQCIMFVREYLHDDNTPEITR